MPAIAAPMTSAAPTFCPNDACERSRKAIHSAAIEAPIAIAIDSSR